MKDVVMNTSIAGHALEDGSLDDFSFAIGDLVTLPDDLADAWIACGHASPFEAPTAEKPRKGKPAKASEGKSTPEAGE